MRADATRPIGTGHVMRSVALCAAAREAGWTAEVWGQVDSTLARRSLDRLGVAIRPAPSDASLTSAAAAADAAVLHVDHYGLADDLGQDPDRRTPVTSAVVDGPFGRRSVDIVIDPSPTALRRHDPIYDDADVLLGPRHVPLRPEISAAAGLTAWRTAVPGSVLVLMGGSDAADLTDRLVADLAGLPWVTSITAVVPGLEDRLLSHAGSRPVPVVRTPTTPDLMSLLSSHSVVVTAAGTTIWELVALSVPFAVLAVSPNQHDNYVWATTAGGAVGLGMLGSGSAPDLTGIETPPAAAAPQGLVDGDGASRILRVWEAAVTRRERSGDHVHVRRADLHDAGRLFAWRDDDRSRAASRSTAPLVWADHLSWLSSQLQREDRQVLVAEAGPHPCVSMRLDHRSHGTWEVSVMTAPQHRGRGLATRALGELSTLAREDDRIAEILATVRTENEVMQRIFLTLGYRPSPCAERGWRQFRLDTVREDPTAAAFPEPRLD